MSDVTLKNIRKKFGNLEVIKGIDLDIKSGEFVVFVGPSGCGKSTLLRIIAGLEHIDGGDLFINNIRMNDYDPSERGIAMVFQSYALYPHMTVSQNMGFALKHAGVSKKEVAQRVDDVAKILDIKALLDRKPKALSGGQRQRVAIGRAIIRNPDVFLFDEPLSNLDAELRVHMRVELARLHNELTATMIYVTHDQVEAMTLADKIVVLKDGLVEQVGTPLEIYDNPKSQFVAGFIGSPKMNFLMAVVTEANETHCKVKLCDFDDSIIKLQPNILLNDGQKITLGLRPENISENGENKIEIIVDMIEHLGHSSFIYARNGMGNSIVLEAGSRKKILSGDKVPAFFDSSSLFIFDEVGKRVA